MKNFARIEKARALIDSIYCSNNVDVERISQEASFSKYHFIRCFKKKFNKTPYKYILEKRLEYAKFKLSESSDSVTSISYETGFESLSYFSLSFKKASGYSPSQFRELYKI